MKHLSPSWVLALLVAVSTGSAGAASETLKCPDMDVRVSAKSRATAERVCRIAQDAQDLLNACNLFQTDPFEIAVVSEMPAAHAECFGVYDCAKDKVEVLEPQAMRAQADEGDPLLELPQDGIFASILLHELAHVFVYQTRGGPGRSFVEDEYIAYAMQMAALPPPQREILLSQVQIETPVMLERINGVILMLAPDAFRARAYLHFAQEGNGCAFVEKVLNGKATFLIDDL